MPNSTLMGKVMPNDNKNTAELLAWGMDSRMTRLKIYVDLKVQNPMFCQWLRFFPSSK